MYSKEETKKALLEVIDGTICLIGGSDVEVCKKIIKKSLHRLYVIVRKQLEETTLHFGFAPKMRKRNPRKYRDFIAPLIAAMRFGFMCSYDPFFIKNINFKDYDAIHKHFFKVRMKGSNMNFIVILREALDKFPIDNCDDFHHLVQSFEMMRDWVHAYGPFLFGIWRCGGCEMRGATPKLLTMNNEQMAIIVYVFDSLASKDLKMVEDVKKLRRKVEAW